MRREEEISKYNQIKIEERMEDIIPSDELDESGICSLIRKIDYDNLEVILYKK